MVETTVAAPATPVTEKKAKKEAKPRKPKSSPTHPKVAEMVTTAIEDLREKGGSSLQAIKKYIAANYKVDIERISIFVRRYLKSAVASGALVQTKGHGASGSFRMNVPASKAPKTARQQAVAAKPKVSTTKKSPKKLAKKPKPLVKKPSPKKLKAKQPAAKKMKVAATKAKKPKAKSSPKKGRK